MINMILTAFLLASVAAIPTACSSTEAPETVGTTATDAAADNTLTENSQENASEPVTQQPSHDTEESKEDARALVMPGAEFHFDDPPIPVWKEASVHDPSVMKIDSTYYVVGSHMASAKTDDLMQWFQISTGPTKGNKLAPNISEDFKEALEWSETTTFWAGDWIQLADGRYYMYYCNCKGDSPRANLGLAIADAPEGPYVNQGIFLKSGMWNEISPDGSIYDATKHPNAIDPDVFFDNDGKLWMVYGSYSGGIFIMEMDPDTGLPLPDQGYGKKLLGANHVRIEGPYIIYSPETEYYYLFLSFGGLDTSGGYNIRVCRSKTPDGPYYDALGQDMINCRGPIGSFFNDRAIEKYGVKLMGNYQFKTNEVEAASYTTGYKSPGHNSAYYDSETGEYFLIFHTRFTAKGESHEIRIHQMFLNEDGWFVVAPKRYGGEKLTSFTKEQLTGNYKVVAHGTDITADVKYSEIVMLEEDGSVTGAYSGSWILGSDGVTAEITLDGVKYNGVFLRQYDDDQKKMIMAFTLLSEEGLAVWGCGVALK